jgi:creatinine amidohydrolase
MMRRRFAMFNSLRKLAPAAFLAGVSLAAYSVPLLAAEGKPLVLQEMTWTDVRDYLKTNDMVVIPLGSTEQHGPHMPLGTDWLEALHMAKLISARTGVVVAPVLEVGYSVYHSGFPGTLSLKPETFVEVLYETAEMLVKYGFKRIMFYNFHGGNIVPQIAAIHRINQNLEAMAVAIGAGSEIQKGAGEVPGVWFDEHAGVGETSIGLFLFPELVHMDRAEKPEIHFSARVQELMRLLPQYPQLAALSGALMAVPEETKKGGSSREISSNGVWSSGDPKTATRELGEKMTNEQVDSAVKFIEAWKLAKN